VLINGKQVISYEAVIHKREQHRKSLEFFQSHELVNADGDTLDMEEVVNASNSNPAHRRNEMMACVKPLHKAGRRGGDTSARLNDENRTSIVSDNYYDLLTAFRYTIIVLWLLLYLTLP
jgi:hypothetical protein